VIIGMTMRVVENITYPDRRDALSHDWFYFLSRLFPQAVLVPLYNHPDHIINTLETLSPDAIILSNGNDWGSAPERDQTETQIITHGIAHQTPILGICRGHQVINAYFAGKICENIKQKTQVHHVAQEHTVELVAPFGNGTLAVNSFHNQGIFPEDLSLALKSFAQSPDAVIEGLYHPQLPIIGIQWHPERPTPSTHFDTPLITKLFQEGAFWHSQGNP
jgi:N5-(cytidine 5'-diphosphoramidyl)-L-glutamine hydrolase